MPDLLDPNLDTFKFLLTRYTGFGFPVSQEHDFHYRIGRALKNCGLELGQLIDRLTNCPGQLEALEILKPILPDLLIGETYFWRDPDIFEALTKFVLPELTGHKADYSRLLRVWSAASSNGEEAYSLSIALTNYFRDSDWTFSIMGSDINGKALEKARKAEYESYSFRGNTNFLSTAFDPLPNGRAWRVKPLYRNKVRFQFLNLASSEYPSPTNDTCNYDLIFCRNVFIYFQPELSQQIISRLYEALNDGGYLVVSPCEYSQQWFQNFETIQLGLVTLYRRPLRFMINLDKGAVRSSSADLNLPEYNPLLKSIGSTVATPATPIPVSREKDKRAAIAKRLEEAKTLKATGFLEESIARCQEAIAFDNLSAESYLLLTELYQRTDQLEKALDMARRYSYLEPECPSGLLQLADLQLAVGQRRRATQTYRRLVAITNYAGLTGVQTNFSGLSATEIRLAALEKLASIEAG